MWLCHDKEWYSKAKNAWCCAKFLCRGCGLQSVDTNWKRMRYTKDIVETSMGLRSEGLSLRRTRVMTKKIKKVLVKSNQTILNWFDRFGKTVKKPMQNLADRLYCDETKVRMWKKGLFLWFWALRCKGMQPAGWHVSMERNMHETKMLMWEARRRFPVSYWPKSIRTDKMPAYGFAIHTVLGHEVRHEKVISFKHGNNVIENFWRCKRSFPRFRTLRGAKKFIDHWMWENFGDDDFWLIAIIRELDTTDTSDHKNYLYYPGRLLFMAIAFPFAGRWIAGEHISDALQRVRENSKKGIHSVVNILGERQKNPKTVQEKVKLHMDLIDEIKNQKLGSDISLKLTNIGLALDKNLAKKNLQLIAKHARKNNVFVWVDMEGSRYADSILNICKKQNVGITLHSQLRRSRFDVYDLMNEGARIRLVKGASGKGHATYRGQEINSNFLYLMSQLFKNSDNITLGTQDLHLIRSASHFARTHRKKFNVHMTMGSRDEYKPVLASMGYNISEYVPFGKEWMPYYTRRMRERLTKARKIISR